MEDVKELFVSTHSPCCSVLVSILVLMEDVKELGSNFVNALRIYFVSILVLMEDVKELESRRSLKILISQFQSLF